MFSKLPKTIFLNESSDLNKEVFRYVDVLAEADEKNVSTVEILKVGKVQDRDLVVTHAMLRDFVKNFEAGVYGGEIQVNFSHDRGGEAAGWILKLFAEDDKLLAAVEWTPVGLEKIKSKQFRYTSSELSLSHPHHETGKKVKNVLIGVALTNIPAVKGMEAVTLSEQAKSFITNQDIMDKLKKLHEALMTFEVITLAQSKKFSEEADAAVKGGADAKEVDGMKTDLEAKVEKPAEGEEGDDEGDEGGDGKEGKGSGDGDGAEGKGDGGDEKKLSEKYVSRKDFLAEQKKSEKLQEKLDTKELQEEFRSELVLSEDNDAGFNNDEATLDEVVEFMKDLSQDQRDAFKKIVAKVRTVDLSVNGTDDGIPKKVKLSEDAIVERTEEILAEKPDMDPGAAQKQAAKELSQKKK